MYFNFMIFNFDFLSILSKTSCGLSVPFFDRFILHMMLPIFCFLAIGGAFLLARLRRANPNSKRYKTQINEMTSKIVILIVLLLFPGLSTKVFQIWKCQEIYGIAGELLVQDFNVVCYQGEHVTYTFLAVTFLFVYILGIPLTMFMLLWRNRKHLHNEKSPKNHWIKTAFGGLYMQCKYGGGCNLWWLQFVVLAMCGFV